METQKSTKTIATSLLQINICLKCLEFEKRTGMKMSRISARDCAKRILGYKSNQRPTFDILISQMSELKNAIISELEQQQD